MPSSYRKTRRAFLSVLIDREYAYELNHWTPPDIEARYRRLQSKLFDLDMDRALRELDAMYGAVRRYVRRQVKIERLHVNLHSRKPFRGIRLI